MQRETKQAKTVNGHEVVFNAYATGREFNEIQACYTKDAKLTMVGKDMRIDNFNPSAEMDAVRKTLELMVVSLDGEKEKEGKSIVDRVLDLRVEDYNEVVEEAKTLSGQKKII
jgi:hypothetical protein